MTDQAALEHDVSISARDGTTRRAHYLDPDLRRDIASQRWDVVVLQDQGDEPLPAGRGTNANLANFNLYVDNLVDSINGSARPGVETYLYETWARPDMIGPNGTNQFYTAAEGLEAMRTDLHNAYF